MITECFGGNLGSSSSPCYVETRIVSDISDRSEANGGSITPCQYIVIAMLLCTLVVLGVKMAIDRCYKLVWGKRKKFHCHGIHPMALELCDSVSISA